MTDFVQDQDKKTLIKDTFIERVVSYSNFLKQSLELGFFVPCLNGNILDEPVFGDFCDGDKKYNQRCEQYQKAKDRVLFEEFENIDFRVIEFSISARDTVEQSIKYNLTLTKSAIKQLGL